MCYKILLLIVIDNTFYNGQSMTTVLAEFKKVISIIEELRADWERMKEELATS